MRSRIDLLMLENGSRGYIATGDPTFLDSAESLRTRLAQHRATLRTLTVDNPEQRRRLDVLNPLIDAGLAEMSNTSQVSKEKGMAAAKAALRLSNGLPRRVEIRNMLTALEDQERDLLTERSRSARLEAQQSNQVILYGTLAGVLLAAFIGIMIHGSITRPLSEFQKYVTSVGEGDLTLKSAPEGKLTSSASWAAV